MITKIRYWVPIGISITLLCGLIYLVGQQGLRMSANDPQIQFSEDIANALSKGQDAGSLVPTSTTDISQSLSPFIIVYNSAGEIIASTAMLDGKTPSLPMGILDYTRAHGQDRLTWQPRIGVRSATVITRYSGIKSGFVLVGRSLREIEKREDTVMMQVGIVWAVTLIASLLATIIFLPKKHKK